MRSKTCTGGGSTGSYSDHGDGVRVVIVDDHDRFRTGLRNLLEEQGVEVIGEAGNGQDAIRSVRELAPEVVVMDLNMPGISSGSR